ncbi:uncharacterized protein LOC130741444 [Lotus japonicus]|uniref:uncharacterized protein LOC130741444 n=1 Tax=Lotus japonicus TaxID=34305 RepID=UPI00258AD3DF|nr:uncharacterized protein LOC130741444 [Lotus japonicus]
MDVTRILQIQLPERGSTDKLIWKDSTNGQYTVKGGYKILRGPGLRREEAGPSSSRDPPLWKKNWAVDVLPSCKEFIWRACRNVLPVYANLKKRGINLDPMCPCCGEEEETTTHAILTCNRTCRLWFGSHLNIHLPASMIDNFKGWLEQILMHPSAEIMADVFNLAWTMWKRRNTWVFEGQMWDAEQTMSKAAKICTYKLNVDAALKPDGMGLGAIIRNDKGQTMAAATKKARAQEDPTMAQALAVKWALEWARQIGFFQISLETDSLILVQQWRRSSLGDSYLHDVIRLCKNLSLGFFLFSVSHVKRSGNKVADFLANLACRSFDFCWIEEDPPGASTQIHDDVSLAVSSALS